MSRLISTIFKRSTLIATSFILAVSSLSAAVPLLLNHNASAVSNIVVTPSSMNGWFGLDDNGHGGSLNFVNGPTAAPLGSGSAQLSINASNQGYMLAKSAYGGLKLSDITNLSYDTYVQQGNNTIAPALQFNVTADVVSNTSWQGRLVYEPYQNGHATVTDGQWESQDALDGLWWFSKPNLFGNNCPQAAPCSLSDIIGLYPSAGISNGQPFVGFKAGSNWTTFVGNIDNFVINSDTYDFEPFTPPAAAAQSSQTVLQSDFANAMNTWTYHSDVTNIADPAATVNHEIVANPTPLVGDNGAVKLNGSVGDKWNLASLQYSGTKLSDIAALGFSIRTSNPGSAYINLDVDFNNPGITSSYQGRLVYVPTETANTWTNIEAVASNGMWEWSNMITGVNSAWPDGNATSARSWNDIVSAFPDARITAINDVAFGSLYLRSDGTSTTYYDHVYLATSTNNVNYNFELPDTTAPDVPTHSSPSDGAVRTTAQQTLIDWSDVSDPSTPVTYFYQSSTSPATNGVGGSFVSPVYTSESLGVSEIPTPSTPEGTYYWHVKACDALSNCSVWSNHWTLHIDNTAPTLPVLQTTPNNGYEQANDFYFTWTPSADTSSVIYEYQSSSTATLDANGSLLNAWNSIANGNSEQNNLTTPQIHSTGAPNGVYYWQVRAIDAAGNKSAWTTPWKMTIDSVAPSVPVITSPFDAAYFNTTPILNKWDASTDAVSGLAHYQIAYNYDDGHSFGGSTCAGLTMSGYSGFIGCRDLAGTSRNHVPGITEQGGVTIWVRAVDNAGNVSNWSIPVHYTYDATAPVVSLTTPTSGNYGFINTVNITADVDDAASYSIYVNGSDVYDGTGAFAPYLLSVVDGTYDIYIKATDAAGNVGMSATATINVDDTAPLLTVVGYTGTSLTPPITGTTDNATDTVTVDGASAAVSATVNGTGTYDWTYTLPTQAIGSHTIIVVSTDTFGNSTTETATVTVNSVPATETTPETTTTTVTPTGTTTTNTADQGVLGDATTTPNDTTTDKTDTPSVLGTSTDKTATSTPWALAWYWWLLIIAAVITLIWAIIAAIRRRRAES